MYRYSHIKQTSCYLQILLTKPVSYYSSSTPCRLNLSNTDWNHAVLPWVQLVCLLTYFNQATMYTKLLFTSILTIFIFFIQAKIVLYLKEFRGLVVGVVCLDGGVIVPSSCSLTVSIMEWLSGVAAPLPWGVEWLLTGSRRELIGKENERLVASVSPMSNIFDANKLFHMSNNLHYP